MAHEHELIFILINKLRKKCIQLKTKQEQTEEEKPHTHTHIL